MNFKGDSRSLFRTILRITENREDAEDALQDTFLRAYLALRSFEGRSSVYSWLTRIAVNSALMILRRRRVRPHTFVESSEGRDGYAVTSHSAQGLTAERVLINADTGVHADLLNSRFGYVAVSRASHEASIFKDHADRLNQRIGTEVTKSSARTLEQITPATRDQGAEMSL